MSKECDVFSDSYGCVITKSIGYQSPFPIVRLSNGVAAWHDDMATVQGACFVSLVDHSAARGRLLTFDLATHDACASFLQLLDTSRPPLVLEAKTAFVYKVDVCGHVSAVVARSESGRCGTSLYVAAGCGDDSNNAMQQQCSRVVFRGATAAAVRDGALWLTSTPTAKEKREETEDGRQLLLYRCTVADALAGALPTEVPLHAATGPPLDVVALTAETAVVLGARGVALADCRQADAHAAVIVAATAPIANGSAAGDDKVVTFGEDHTLRVFDLRSVARPLLEASTLSYVCVRSASGCRAALLVTGDVTGVFDVQTLTITASLQHCGDVVLDATVLSHRHGRARICTSTASGMLYDWTVAM